MSIPGWSPRAMSRSSSSAWSSSSRAAAMCARARIGVGGQLALGEPQRERERHEALLGTVVEVSLEPAALGVARGDEPGARAGELLPRVGSRDRKPDQLGELRESILRPGRQRIGTVRPGHDRPPAPPRNGYGRGDGALEAGSAHELGDLALLASVVVEPGRASRPEDLPGDALVLDRIRDAELDLLERPVAADHGRRLVASSKRTMAALSAPKSVAVSSVTKPKTSSGSRVSGYERCDAPQRGLLLGQSPETLFWRRRTAFHAGRSIRI